jgi:hypothetical protein
MESTAPGRVERQEEPFTSNMSQTLALPSAPGIGAVSLATTGDLTGQARPETRVHQGSPAVRACMQDIVT